MDNQDRLSQPFHPIRIDFFIHLIHFITIHLYIHYQSQSLSKYFSGVGGDPLWTLVPWYTYTVQFWFLAHFSGIRFAPGGCAELVFAVAGLHLVYVSLRNICAGLCSIQFPILHKTTLPLTVYCLVNFLNILTAPAGTDGIYRYPFKKNDTDAGGLLTHQQAL
jgi:hypothetical protein